MKPYMRNSFLFMKKKLLTKQMISFITRREREQNQS